MQFEEGCGIGGNEPRNIRIAPRLSQGGDYIFYSCLGRGISLCQKPFGGNGARSVAAESGAKREVASRAEKHLRGGSLAAKSMYAPLLTRMQIAVQPGKYVHPFYAVDYHWLAGSLANLKLTAKQEQLTKQRDIAGKVDARFSYCHYIPTRCQLGQTLEVCFRSLRRIPGMNAHAVKLLIYGCEIRRGTTHHSLRLRRRMMRMYVEYSVEHLLI